MVENRVFLKYFNKLSVYRCDLVISNLKFYYNKFVSSDVYKLMF